MEKHKAPAQLPTNEPSLELQIFKKSIGGTLGGAIGPVVVFPLYWGRADKTKHSWAKTGPPEAPRGPRGPQLRLGPKTT